MKLQNSQNELLSELSKVAKKLGVEVKTNTFAQHIRKNFSNGYGVSIICGSYTYGGPELLELAVTRGGNLCYDTPVTNDVEGFLTAEQALSLVDQIINLPKLPEEKLFTNKGNKK